MAKRTVWLVTWENNESDDRSPVIICGTRKRALRAALGLMGEDALVVEDDVFDPDDDLDAPHEAYVSIAQRWVD